MHRINKIATCCYCGTRAVLTLTGEDRHELACSGCGAPLRQMHHIPVSRPSKPKPHAEPRDGRVRRPSKKLKKAKKKGKSLFAEAFDLIEDIFD